MGKGRKIEGISRREFARRNGCSDTAIRKRIRSGKLPVRPDGLLDPRLVGLVFDRGVDAIATCVECLRAFHYLRSGRPRIYCSKKCRDSLLLREQAQRNRQNPVYSSCLVCGTRYVNWTGSKRYCSVPCQKEGVRRREHNQKHLKRSRLKNQADGSLTDSVLAKLYSAATNCAYCQIKLTRRSRKTRQTDATIDHVIPLVLGGQHSISNVVVCCSLCNSKKGNRTSWPGFRAA
jgi:5-methylcytosine-specific restriction endonuclease McrA